MPPGETPRGSRVLAPASGKAMVAWVRERLHHDPSWQTFTADLRWICPWCLAVVGRRPQRSWEDSIAAHLEACRHFAGGTRPQLATEMVQAQIAFENLVHRAKTDPAWQVYDAGVWVCPACLERIPPVRVIGEGPSALTYREMAAHLQGCAAYAAGRLHPVEAVRAVLAPPVATPVGGTRTLAPPSGAAVSATPTGGTRSQSSSPTRVTIPAFVLPATRPLPPVSPPAAAPAAPPALELSWMDEVDRMAAHAQQENRPSEDLLRARDLQQRLLSEAPAVPGFAFATRYEPCDHVSGDFFSFVRLPSGDIGFAIGDVSGHGMQAGLVMSMAKKALEIYAAQGGDPCTVLARVNDALASDLGGTMFVTITYAVLSPSRRSIRWVRAGHPPVLMCNHLLGTSGEIRPAGMALGMKTGALFRDSLEEQEIDVVAGDVFLLYTDGIPETVNAQGEEFGEERLREIFIRHAALGVDALLTQVMDRVRHFRGPGLARDDLTLLALGVT